MTAGYSGTPLAKKLGLKPEMAILALNAPEDYANLIADEGITFIEEYTDRLNGHFVKVFSGREHVIHLFTNSRDELLRNLPILKKLIRQDGAIWVSWYKKAAKLPTEITEDTVREAAFPLGLVDVKVCAVDEKWSGLKLVIRKENRI